MINGQNQKMRTDKSPFDTQNPRSDQFINYPDNFNTLSSRQVMRIKKIINYRTAFCVDIKPDSEEQPTKKCMVIS